MKKSSTTNTFAKGMIMDLNPMTFPSDSVCNALNATITTMNGNEHVLQNDMGNGRVETAFLPSGYIPMGTAELGGIIYVVSYNPLIDKCQIGSFPSPERNISSEEYITPTIEISNQNFQDPYKINKDEKLYVSSDDNHVIIKNTIFKVNLLDTSSIMKLNPGDKYSIYSNGIQQNSNYISDCKLNDPDKINKTPRHVTIRVISIDDTGNITYLDDLKWIESGEIKENEEDKKLEKIKYYIKQADVTNETGIKQDIDSYRNLVTTAYNIFTSKISGQLGLLFEVNIINSFSLTYNALYYETIVNDVKQQGYKVDFYTNWTSNHSSINPKYLILDTSELTNIAFGEDNPKSGYYLNIPDDALKNRKNDGSDKDILIDVGTCSVISPISIDRIWKYSIVPAMQYGEIKQFTTQGYINFGLVGTNTINIHQWRYFIQKNSIILNLGISAYLDNITTIEKVELLFTPYYKLYTKSGDTLTYNTEALSNNKDNANNFYNYKYTINNRGSYSGNFQEIINYEKLLHKDCLYVVDIAIFINKKSSDTSEIKHFFKFLWTTDQFNDQYVEGKINDFSEIKDWSPKFSIEGTYTDNSKINTDTVYSSLPISIPEYGSLAYEKCMLGMEITSIQNKGGNIKYTLDVKSNNNLFDFKYKKDYINSIKIQSESSNIQYDSLQVVSDSNSNISNAILPIQNTETTIDSVRNAYNNIIKGDIKAYDDNAVDIYNLTMNIESLPETLSNLECTLEGYIFSRTNADLKEKEVTPGQIVRPIALYEDDLYNLGIEKIRSLDDIDKSLSIEDCFKLSDLFGYAQHFNKGGKPTIQYAHLFRYDINDISTISYRGNRDYKKDEDGPEYNNYWDEITYNNFLNPWMQATNSPFTLVRYQTLDKKDNDGTNYNIHQSDPHNGFKCTKKVSVWVRTDEGHYLPLFGPIVNSKDITTSESTAEGYKWRILMTAIISAYLQIYYVETNNIKPISMPLVSNINKLKPYTVTWNISINNEINIKKDSYDEVVHLNYSIYDISISKFKELMRKQKSIDINLNNLIIQLNNINGKSYYSKQFKINPYKIYDIYEEYKSSSIASVYELITEQGYIIGTPKNSSTLYTYDYENNNIVSLSEPNNAKFISPNLKLSKVDLDTGRITVKKPFNYDKYGYMNQKVYSTASELYKHMYINSEGKLVAKESALLKGTTPMYFYPDNGEYTTIKGSPVISWHITYRV